MSYRLGLDTGGTYTDAVLMDEQDNVVARAKALTTHHALQVGLREAAGQVLAQRADAARELTLVSMSTTLATNALVEGRGGPVGLVLIGFDTEHGLARAGLAEALGEDPWCSIGGGHDAAGRQRAPLDETALLAFIDQHDAAVEAFAVSAMFAVRNSEHERASQALIQARTGKPVSAGRVLSSALDAHRRALTALLNARLIASIGELLHACRQMLSDWHIHVPLMVVKGDGSLIEASVAAEAPVETILSGPAASVVGARFLARCTNMLVADMGGTTTDIAQVHAGTPRLNELGATVGGWRTMVRAIDVHTVGLGGDSAVRFDHQLRDFTLGPQRVLPLSLLIEQHPHLLEILARQAEARHVNAHFGQFVLARTALPGALTPQQRRVWRALERGPVAVADLFIEQTLERALHRLIQRGVVMRAAFTPSDACHVLGQWSAWNAEAAVLGADMLRRHAAQNLGIVWPDAQALARHIQARVARRAALAMLQCVLSTEPSPAQTQRSTQDLLERCLDAPEGPPAKRWLSLSARLAVPIVALGAPVRSYYPACAELLGTDVLVPDGAEVANAIGAVVGMVRQQIELVISAAGGQQVRVHLASGPMLCSTLEAGAKLAEQAASAQAEAQALRAGAESISVSVERHDTTVEADGACVFFESRIRATAVGRPALERAVSNGVP